jgi:hypothetical protein
MLGTKGTKCHVNLDDPTLLSFAPCAWLGCSGYLASAQWVRAEQDVPIRIRSSEQRESGRDISSAGPHACVDNRRLQKSLCYDFPENLNA